MRPTKKPSFRWLKPSTFFFRGNPALRYLDVGVPRPEDAIKLAGFGVHGNDYLALQEFLPTIDENPDTHELKPSWKQSQFGHPANWRHDTVEFCLSAFLDTTLKLQRAAWIPGALPFHSVYEYKVKALDAVDIWKERPAEGDTVPALFSLKPGEFIIASDVLQLPASEDGLFNLLTGRRSALAGVGPRKKF